MFVEWYGPHSPSHLIGFTMQLAITVCLALAASAHAHIAAFTKGMYCLNVSLIHIIHVHGVSTEFRLYDWAGIYWK